MVGGALASVAAHGLPGGACTWPVAPLDADGWRELLADATRERIAPLLATAVADGALPATPEQRHDAFLAHERAMRLCVTLERRLLDLDAELGDAGIPYRVLKGPAVARLDYADAAWRAFGDLDVLVPSERYDDAVARLVRGGGERRYREARAGFDRRFGKGVCVVEADGTQVDLHRTFVAGPFGLTIDLERLFAAADPVTVGDRRLWALDRPARFVHACYHAALGDEVPRLATLRDIAQLALTTPLDVEAALALARAWRAEAAVARGVLLAWSSLELPDHELARWAQQLRPDRFQARALRSYTHPGAGYAARAAAGLGAVRGVPAKVAYGRALLFPERDHLQGRDASYAARFRRAWRSARPAKATR
jgi:hypothetical protein